MEDGSQTHSQTSDSDDDAGIGWLAGLCPSFLPALGNFSIQYNYACASMAVAIMLSHDDRRVPTYQADFPEPEWAKEFMLGIVFIGSVVGMLVMGYLGDLLGNGPAMIVTNVLVVFGAIASALLSWGNPQVVWGVIAASRFCLGVGVGGLYPLSAARAAAHAKTSDPEDGAKKAAAAFFWQGPGACAPYLFALVLLQLPHVGGITSIQFRLLLAAGAVPASMVLAAAVREALQEDTKAIKGDAAAQHAGGAQRSEALKDLRHWRVLVGTAGTWFLFDVAFYGTVVFQPVILAEVFGSHETLEGLAQHALLVSFLGALGIGCGLIALRYISAKALNTAGLTLGGVLFLILMRLFKTRPDASSLLFGALCALFFVLYLGPNVATYVLPVICFPSEVRSTFHGLSAAAAKIGAMTGSILFPLIHRTYGLPAVLATQAGICFAGAILSQLCLPGHEELLRARGEWSSEAETTHEPANEDCEEVGSSDELMGRKQ